MLTNILLATCVALAMLLVFMVWKLLQRQTNASTGIDLSHRFDELARALDRSETMLKDELSRNRDEAASSSRQLREEVNKAIAGLVDSVLAQIKAFGEFQTRQLDLFANQLKETGQLTSSKLDSARTANSEQLKNFGETLGAFQQRQHDALAGTIKSFTDLHENKLDALRSAIDQRLQLMQEHFGTTGKQLREEVNMAIGTLTEGIKGQVHSFTEFQARQLDAFANQLKAFTQSTEQKLESTQTSSARQLKEFGEALNGFQKQQHDALTGHIKNLTDANEKRLDSLRSTLDQRLQQIQEDNSKKLEAMRTTVDEKLQGTLEKRLGESFKLVSERLELVHKGLGEMQSLANGVGDLKRVLTNVKTRGNWGEIQLGALLEQMLIPSQYEINVATGDTSERVEYAIKLPGKHAQAGEFVWLPIDAKFPTESYQRLVEAQEAADVVATSLAMKELETRVKGCAKDICTKYINPPKTTDFGIMFLPTEGLYAEIIRRTGLVESIQREYRIVIAGPTTLAALLNSLQMGFRTLAIEKRSSEVWELLGGVKTEFGKFGDVIGNVQQKLLSASNEFDKVAVRTRAINRKLRGVQELDQDKTTQLLAESNFAGNGSSLIANDTESDPPNTEI